MHTEKEVEDVRRPVKICNLNGLVLMEQDGSRTV